MLKRGEIVMSYQDTADELNKESQSGSEHSERRGGGEGNEDYGSVPLESRLSVGDFEKIQSAFKSSFLTTYEEPKFDGLSSCSVHLH
ncbi:cilia- and flagella-associated protein 337-like [Thomomys bottae]